MNHKQTIVHSVRALRNYPRKHIDDATVNLLRQSIPVGSYKSDSRNSLINLLDCYLGLTGQSITYLSLSKTSINKLFAGFVGALWCDSFLKASDITRDSYTRYVSRGLKIMAGEFDTLSFDFDQETSLRLWRKMDISPLQQEYYQGWYTKSKHGKRGRPLALAWVWNTLGPETARALNKTATAFIERYEGRSANNFVPLINEFLKYMESTCPTISEADLNQTSFTVEIIENFCRSFFERTVAKDNCLQTAIKRWNDAVPFLETVLLDSGVFARPYRKFPYIEPSRKIGAEHKLSVTADGTLVKEKLIVDIPLELTDDEAIELLFKKINRDVDAVLTWAQQEATSILIRFRSGLKEYDYMDFDLTSRQIRSKYRTTRLKDAQAIQIANRLGLPTSYALEPFIYLLIKEHPSITEAFLFGLKLFDKRGKQVGLETTDGCTYLVGNKKRSGAKRASQRIALSDKAIALVDQVIELTTPLRNYLKAKNDDNYRHLFLSCRTGFCYPIPIKDPLFSSASAAFSSRVAQFKEALGQEDEKAINELVKRLTPTKFRATVGLQVFLKTGSTKTMSEALGHAKYKPDLLSHYLPEPILAFFQARWIRIFQKGMICEAMKDSPQLLRASHFKSMKELDQFLRNHALSLPNDVDESDTIGETDVRELCINVDENVLTALLSLEAAVEEGDQDRISAKAAFWAKFSSLLQVEIESVTLDLDILHALNAARVNANPSQMRKLIY